MLPYYFTGAINGGMKADTSRAKADTAASDTGLLIPGQLSGLIPGLLTHTVYSVPAESSVPE
jgi:hypothetical protein